jgi:hypothetical protein
MLCRIGFADLGVSVEQRKRHQHLSKFVRVPPPARLRTGILRPFQSIDGLVAPLRAFTCDQLCDFDNTVATHVNARRPSNHMLNLMLRSAANFTMDLAGHGQAREHRPRKRRMWTQFHLWATMIRRPGSSRDNSALVVAGNDSRFCARAAAAHSAASPITEGVY